MGSDATSSASFRFPQLLTTCRLSDSTCFWDIRFYPYSDSVEQCPVFAVVGTSQLLICNLSDDEEVNVNVLQILRSEIVNTPAEINTINSCTWCYVTPSQPLIAVAGDSGQINVLRALTGKVYAVLIGHGIGVINDLATHPRYPWIIASASMDTSLRIWDLRRTKEPHESTCIIICGHGLAHREGLLTVGWHSSGRYLVSGGHDQKICVWTIPDLDDKSTFWHKISREGRKSSSDDVHVVHYPHFVSSAIHSDYIDKAVFFGDLILSKAAQENKIVLWQITGFSSCQPPPLPETAPKTNEYLDTRNGFVRIAGAALRGESSIAVQDRYRGKPLYQRHLEFDSPKCPSFYMRFGFLQPSRAHPTVHPTLVIGNVNSEIRFWDIERLIVGHDGGLSESRADRSSGIARIPGSKRGIAKRKNNTKDRVASVACSDTPSRLGSTDSSTNSQSAATPSTTQFRETSTEATSHGSDIRASIESLVPDRVKYAIDNPHKQILEHKKVKLTDMPEATLRASDWSPCGRWCIVVGEWQVTAVAAILAKPT